MNFFLMIIILETQVHVTLTLHVTLSIDSIKYTDLSLVLIDYTGLNESQSVLNTCFLE